MLGTRYIKKPIVLWNFDFLYYDCCNDIFFIISLMTWNKKTKLLIQRYTFLTIFSLALLLNFPVNLAFAAPKNAVDSGGASKGVGEEYVRNFVQVTIDKTLNIVNSKQTEAQKSTELRQVFEQCVDIDVMAKMALGKRWVSLTAAQRQEYLAAYRNYLIKTFVPKFKDYNSQKILINKINQVDDKKFVVSMQLVNADVAPSSVNNAKKINISYRIFAVPSAKGIELKIRDIVIEEMSLLRTQRDDFSSTVTTKGIDGLIATLQAK